MARIPGSLLGDMISGSQVAMHGIRMFRQMVRVCLTWGILLILIFVSWNLWQIKRQHPQQIDAAIMYGKATWLGIIYSDDTVFHFTRRDGRPGSVSITQVRTLPAFRASWVATRDRLVGDAVLGIICAGGIMLLFLIWFRWVGFRLRQTRSLRGASLTTPTALDKQTQRTFRLFWDRKSPRYRLANVTYPRGNEMRHTMIVGSTGTGKTTAISQLLAQIRGEGGKAIIYDKMGSYIPHFYHEDRDIILNPLDARSHDWDMFGEVRHEREWDTIAKAIIPAFKDTADPFWTTAARQLFAVGCAALWKQNKGSIPVIVDRLLKTEINELVKEMEDTVVQGLVDVRHDKMTTSIRAILTTAMRPLVYMAEPKRPFSIRNWIESAENSALFLSSGGWDHEMRQALIATQMEVAIVSLISGTRHPDRRIWFIIDELPTMEQIPSLKSALAESRQFGGCFVIGTQVVSELREIYGRDTAETISGNCNTRLTLGTPDMATAEWCANQLGRSQTVQMNKSLSFGASEVRDGVAISQREQISNIVLPSELMELPPLNGYLRMGGGFPVTRVKLERRDWPEVAAHFVQAEVPDPKTGEIYDVTKPKPPIPIADPASMEYPNSPIVNEPKYLKEDIPANNGEDHAFTNHPLDNASSPPQWHGPSPSGPPGYLMDIPPETDSSATKTKTKGKKTGKPRKTRGTSAPMGQSNAPMQSETAPSSNPDHQAALDFQAPTEPDGKQIEGAAIDQNNASAYQSPASSPDDAKHEDDIGDNRW